MNKLLVGLLLSVGIGSANAANWVYSGESANANGSIVASYIDASSLVFTDKTRQTRSAWIKMYSVDNTHLLMRYVVHCPSKMNYSQIEHVYSSTTGKFLYTSNNYNPQWEYSIPGTMGEIWANHLCKI